MTVLRFVTRLKVSVIDCFGDEFCLRLIPIFAHAGIHKPHNLSKIIIFIKFDKNVSYFNKKNFNLSAFFLDKIIYIKFCKYYLQNFFLATSLLNNLDHPNNHRLFPQMYGQSLQI